jgi:hypothetical protein
MGDVPDSAPENKLPQRPPNILFPSGGEGRLNAERRGAPDRSPCRNLRPEEVEVLRVALGDTLRQGQAFRRGMALALLLGAPLILLVILIFGVNLR